MSNTGKSDRFKVFMEQQKKEMELWKWNRGIELHRDPGPECLIEWINKYAEAFRKKFIMSDLKASLTELQGMRGYIQEYLDKIALLNRVINNCETKIMESIELLGEEKSNGV